MTNCVGRCRDVSTFCVSPRPPADRRIGFSLLEATIYAAVLIVIGAPIMMMTMSATRSTTETQNLSRVLERNRSALQRIAGDLRMALDSSVTVSNTGKTLTFTLPGTFDGAGPTGGDIVSYAIQNDPTDPANGSDDNQNGVVDEMVLVRVNQTTGEQVTVASNLDDARTGFEVAINGVLVTMSSVRVDKHTNTERRMSQTVMLYARN